ncbi:MAG TPA: hypothetical protein VFD43_08115, partial [Planctomycetota bacterium]|nr:hypothetical protein [Planctomycetota bacterium]
MRASRTARGTAILHAAVAAALLLACACASDAIETRTVLVVDGAALPASAGPLDLEAEARSQGCAVAAPGPGICVSLTIEAVVTPFEYVVLGRYGHERVRPLLQPETLARLQACDGRHGDVVRQLGVALAGRELLEPVEDGSPVAGSDGLRLVRLRRADGDTIDEI